MARERSSSAMIMVTPRTTSLRSWCPIKRRQGSYQDYLHVTLKSLFSFHQLFFSWILSPNPLYRTLNNWYSLPYIRVGGINGCIFSHNNKSVLVCNAALRFIVTTTNVFFSLFSFFSVTSQLSHQSTHQEPDKHYYCRLEGCVYSTFRKKDILSHLQSHGVAPPGERAVAFAVAPSRDNARLFRCKVTGCNYGAQRQGDLTIHNRTHTGNVTFKETPFRAHSFYLLHLLLVCIII